MPLDNIIQSLPDKGKRAKATTTKKDKIVIYPKLETDLDEAKESTAVMAFGRFNPPTVGHEKLIHKVHEVAKEHDGSAHVVASHSEGTSKDPLPQSKKLDYIKKVAPEGVHVSGSSKESPSFLHAAKKLHQAGHKHLVMVAGSDRVKEYEQKLHQYNGKEGHYNFKSIKVVSSGERDPDAEGVEGMSGTKMRAHARAGEHDKFKSGLPKTLHPHAKEIADHIRSIKEEVISERIVTLPQRRERALQMKRLASRLKVARNIARQRLAPEYIIKRRAKKTAKSMLRRRFAGGLGVKYQTLSPSDKVLVDKQIDNKVFLIKKLVQRIVPRIKQAEVRRFEGVKSGKFVKPHPMPLMMSMDVNDLFKMSFDKSIDSYKMFEQIYEAFILNEKDEKSLTEKAEKNKVSFDLLEQIMSRGINEWTPDSNKTPKQLGFERVNSFLALGKSFREDDADLAEGLKNPKDNPCWKGYKPVGTKKKNGREVPNCVPEEAQINEISTKTKLSYVAKAATSTNEPKDGEKQSDYLERLHKRMKGIKRALSLTNPSQRFQKEEHGAGDEGTEKLVKKYKKDTPCQENFMDGRNPQDKGDMARHGLKGKTIAQLKKIRSSKSASSRTKQLAHWSINMRQGKK